MAKKSKKINKKLIYIIGSIILTFVVLNVSMLAYNYFNDVNIKNQQIATSTKPAADKIHDMAVNALETNRIQAKALFETAKRQYEYILENTTEQAIHDHAQNMKIDCDGQLWMLNHE